MAVQKSLSLEDANLTSPSIVGYRSRNYSDLDLTFTPRTTGDVFKKLDAAAVKQSVKTILQTNHYERPFNPFFGANIRSKLFDNYTLEENAVFMKNDISKVLRIYEPRAEVLDVNVSAIPDANSLSVTVKFRIVNTEEIVVLDTTISRIR